MVGLKVGTYALLTAVISKIKIRCILQLSMGNESSGWLFTCNVNLIVAG